MAGWYKTRCKKWYCHKCVLANSWQESLVRQNDEDASGWICDACSRHAKHLRAVDEALVASAPPAPSADSAGPVSSSCAQCDRVFETTCGLKCNLTWVLRAAGWYGTKSKNWYCHACVLASNWLSALPYSEAVASLWICQDCVLYARRWRADEPSYVR